MSNYYIANGFTPTTEGAVQGNRFLLDWLVHSVEGGLFNGRMPMAPSPWRWSQEIQPSQTIRHLTVDPRPINREVEQTLYNLMAIPISSGGFSKGYVTRRAATETREPNVVPRGQPGGPFNPTSAEQPYQATFWDVVRVLPDDSTEATHWGYTFQNRTQWQVILEEGRRYNMTLRERLLEGYSAGRAHASAVRDMRQQSIQLMYQAGIQLAMSIGTANAMNFAPALGDYAAEGRARMQAM